MVGTVNMRERLGRWVEGRAVSNFIIGVIVFNAGLLGMETAPALMEKYGTLILFLDLPVHFHRRDHAQDHCARGRILPQRVECL